MNELRDSTAIAHHECVYYVTKHVVDMTLSSFVNGVTISIVEDPRLRPMRAFGVAHPAVVSDHVPLVSKASLKFYREFWLHDRFPTCSFENVTSGVPHFYRHARIYLDQNLPKFLRSLDIHFT